MAKLTSAIQDLSHDPGSIGSLLASLCIMIAMIYSLIGIKIWWFKHRLSFEQSSERNRTAGGRQSVYAFTQRSSSSNSVRDRQMTGATETHGIFRKREEDEWDIERPTVLPPVRLAESTPDLNLASLTSKENFPTVPRRKRKETRSAIFEPLEPPTRDPPRPPIEQSNVSTLREAETLEGFSQFQNVTTKQTRPTTLALESIRVLPRLPETQTPIDLTVEESQALPKIIHRNHEPYAIESGVINLFQERKFNNGKLAHETENKDNITEFQLNKEDHQELIQPQPKPRQKQVSSSSSMKRDSYIEYEKVDEICNFDEAAFRPLNKNFTPNIDSPDDSTHFTPNMDSPDNSAHFRKPDNFLENSTQKHTSTLFDDLEDLSPEGTVQHIWVRIEQNNFQTSSTDTDIEQISGVDVHDLEKKFQEIRHSNEMNEADILDIRQELNELQDEIVTTPTGFGRNIDEDWENFENLSIVTTPDQTCTPPFEQLHSDQEIITTVTGIATTTGNDLFHDLEVLPNDDTAINVNNLFQELEVSEEEIGGAATVATVAQGETAFDMLEPDDDEIKLKLPDYDSIMADDTIDYRLPNYETAMENAAKLKLKQIQTKYVHNIEDLYNELSLTTDKVVQPEPAGPIEEESESTAYVTNIEELYEELGLDNRHSSSNDFQNIHPEVKRRLKVRFDIDKSQYYQPEELSPESERSFQLEIPKPMQRLINQHIETNGNLPDYSSSDSHRPPMLFVTQVSTIEDGHDNLNTNNSWTAISEHRNMTGQIQHNISNMSSDLSEVPTPATRNPLVNTAVHTEVKPRPAVRKSGSSSRDHQPNKELKTEPDILDGTT